MQSRAGGPRHGKWKLTGALGSLLGWGAGKNHRLALGAPPSSSACLSWRTQEDGGTWMPTCPPLKPCLEHQLPPLSTGGKKPVGRGAPGTCEVVPSPAFPPGVSEGTRNESQDQVPCCRGEPSAPHLRIHGHCGDSRRGLPGLRDPTRHAEGSQRVPGALPLPPSLPLLGRSRGGDPSTHRLTCAQSLPGPSPS